MDPESDETVLLTTYSDSMQANIAKGQLEEAGIHAFLSDEHIVNANPLLGGAVGGVKLWVRDSEAADAKEILEEVPDDSDPLSPDGEELMDLDAEDELPETIPTCPKCGGQDIGFSTSFSVFWAVVVLSIAAPVFLPIGETIGFAVTATLIALGFVLLFLRKFRLRCKDCSETGSREHFEDNPRADTSTA